LIVGLRIKGETVDEVSGMVDAMLDTCEPISPGRQRGRHRRDRAARPPAGCTP
jgi:anthranilate phosphoribosyltransferase